MAELRELAAGRADLLAEVADVLEGASEGEIDEPLARQAAGLCREAGADPEAGTGDHRGAGAQGRRPAASVLGRGPRTAVSLLQAPPTPDPAPRPSAA